MEKIGCAQKEPATKKKQKTPSLEMGSTWISEHGETPEVGSHQGGEIIAGSVAEKDVVRTGERCCLAHQRGRA